MEFLKYKFNTKYADQMADNLAQSLGVTDNSIKAPDLEGLTKDTSLAKILLSALNGYGTTFEEDASELTAILLYISQKDLFDNFSDLFMKIALVEMWHYALLQEAIIKLGGKIEKQSSQINPGNSEKSALGNALEAEEKAIESYNKILNKLANKKDSNSETIKLLIQKILADEVIHLNLFKEELEKVKSAENNPINDLKIKI